MVSELSETYYELFQECLTSVYVVLCVHHAGFFQPSLATAYSSCKGIIFAGYPAAAKLNCFRHIVHAKSIY